MRVRPTTQRFSSFALGSGATSSRRCCCHEGVPLLLGGDEFARSQGGNNNAYCQDNELTWFDWSATEEHADLVEFTARLCRLRERHAVFRRRQFFHGAPAHESERDDLDWYRPDGYR